MTTPNNKAGEEFNEEEWLADMLFVTGGKLTETNWKALLVLVEYKVIFTRQEAIAGETERVAEVVVSHLKHPPQIEHECFKEILGKVTPSPDTSREL